MDENTKLALIGLRDHFETIIDHNDQRYAQIDAAQREALRVALAANDKRLEILNGFRDAMADQAQRMVTRTEAEVSRNILIEKIEANRLSLEARIEAEVRPIQARLEVIGRPNWALMTSVASAGFLVVAAVWLVIGLKIDATLSPLSLDVTQIRAGQISNTDRINVLNNMATASTAADNASKADRQQLNERSHRLEEQSASRRTESSVVQARMVEIETQFCARDSISNLMHANDLRVISMLWNKTFDGSVFPTDNAFYPKVCNQNPPSLKEQ